MKRTNEIEMGREGEKAVCALCRDALLGRRKRNKEREKEKGERGKDGEGGEG